MMTQHGRSAFQEWASQYSGKLFVMLTVFVDETGIGGIQSDGKEPAPGVYGFIATPAYWESFRQEWGNGLKRHGADRFHFYELSPTARKDPKYPRFFGWSDQRADDFIYDMAIIATTKAIPFGGDASQKQLGQKKSYKAAFDSFFKDFGSVMKDFYPKFKEKVSFFIADFENDPWLLALNKSKKDASHRDSRIGELAFVNPYSEDGHGYPCQAADLFAYRNRQVMQSAYDSGSYSPMKLLDFMFSRTASRPNHPLSELRTLSDFEWRDMVNKLRVEKRAFEDRNKAMGGSKDNYFRPAKHSSMVVDFLSSRMEKYRKTPEYIRVVKSLEWPL